MLPVSQYKFYELGVKLHALFNCRAQAKITDLFTPLMEAQAALDAMIKGDPVPLEAARTDANRLLGKLSSLFNKYFIDPVSKQFRFPQGDEKVDQHEMSMLSSLLEKFEMALAAEVGRTPTYAVPKRGIYATEDLVEQADAVLPETVRLHLPTSAMEDYRAAGRSIAFGLGTGAAMHVLRAIEQMMQRYYDSFAGAPLGPKTERNWSNYVKRLNALCDESLDTESDKRIVQMLTQIRDRYRNPLLNVEASISVDEAMTLFNLGASAMVMMAEQIDARLAKTKARNGNVGIGAAVDPVPGFEEDEYREVYEFRLPQSA